MLEVGKSLWFVFASQKPRFRKSLVVVLVSKKLNLQNPNGCYHLKKLDLGNPYGCYHLKKLDLGNPYGCYHLKKLDLGNP